MAIPNATLQAAATAVKNLGSWISVHTSAGGTTGANEATGGGYARKQTTWPAGSMVGSAYTFVGSTVNIPVAAGTYAEAGIWSASTSGTFVASAAFSGGSVVVSGSGASIDVTPTVAA